MAVGLALSTCLLIAAPAHAQLSGQVSIESDYRNRGYSVTDAKPAVTGSLSYDHKSGIYANGLLIVAASDSDAGLSGFEVNLGYAVKVSQRAAVEAGIVRTEYATAPGASLSLKYTEVYAGLTVGRFAARAYYSPNYIGKDRRTLYTQIQANIVPLKDWNLSLSVGALTYLTDPPRYTKRSRYDWRATISRHVGPAEIYASLTGRGPGSDYYARSRGRAVITAGAAISF